MVKTRGGPAAASKRRAPRVERAAATPTNVLLDRVFLIQGEGAATLAAGLVDAGIHARVIAPDAVETVIAGLIISEDGPALESVAAALRPIRRRGLAVGCLVLADHPLEDVVDALSEFCDVVLPPKTPPALIAAQVRTLARLIALDPPSSEPETILARDIIVDMERREASARGTPLALTPTEFLLLALLARKRGVVTHAELYREIHDEDAKTDDMKAVIKVHIWRLRAKLTEAIPDYAAVVNVRGFGYLLERRMPHVVVQREEVDS